MNQFETYIKQIKDKKNLSTEQTVSIFETIMTGQMKDEEIENFLVSLSMKGESEDELAGGISVLRDKAVKVNTPINTIDTCGTGGDGKNTLNISTASAIVLSSMGVKVAKHGNKALSSKCGSADVLQALKVNINLKPNEVEKCINETNFGFMFAPNYHTAMKFVGPVRKKIGKKTIFNLIGPLSSPANVKRQIVGVYSKKWLLPFAKALNKLNSEFSWIVHSEDGMDEISPVAPTNIIEIRKGKINNLRIDPKKLGIDIKNDSNFKGEDSEFNSKKIIDIFSGNFNDFAVVVSLNVAAGLIISEKIEKFDDAYNLAKSHISSGKTLDHLKKIQQF
tara:strand:- start:27 stop:1031 length:1005 start_codon:yes stop_codon:yes gene_type:complete